MRRPATACFFFGCLRVFLDVLLVFTVGLSLKCLSSCIKVPTFPTFCRGKWLVLCFATATCSFLLEVWEKGLEYVGQVFLKVS